MGADPEKEAVPRVAETWRARKGSLREEQGGNSEVVWGRGVGGSITPCQHRVPELDSPRLNSALLCLDLLLRRTLFSIPCGRPVVEEEANAQVRRDLASPGEG